MFSSDQYELLDIGAGRKLERFGRYILDRPAPAAAEDARQQPASWPDADAHFARTGTGRGVWSCRADMPQAWRIRHGAMVFELRCTDSGAVGVYPEQAENWDWIAKQIGSANRRLKILNLFAYSGGSTLAAAAAGAQVVHVDAARAAVNWARHNARLTGLETAPIRWITEDARKFANREVRRGSEYDAVILDPPTYGHGPKSESWKFDQHLDDLLHAVRSLTRTRRTFTLLTCHTPGVGTGELKQRLANATCETSPADVFAQPLVLSTPAGRRLHSGVAARWPGR